ncbi:MAG: TonB-dependent receptor [Deferribacteraceae bacterium]|jgi:iron complex outermembrane receptor protein|nr:TonB-dependent receptor [Deferribacteraceae bacterium]
MIKNIITLFLLLSVCGAFAEELEIFEMEPIEVVGERQKYSGVEITREDMEKTGVQDLRQALNRVPGITISEGNARGESSFNIRGFDSSYIPVIVDGISITSPFNGRGDSSGLLIGDMESITVQKGYSSMLMGANGMGGAVLLTASKPKKTFEFYLKDAVELDDTFSLSVNNFTASAGSKLDTFYFKTTFQHRDTGHTRLPDAYTPMQGSVQNKGERLFSDREDSKTTVIAGTTPADGLDIWAAYIYETSDRGMNPPEAGPLYSLWGWDNWEHQSISLHSDYKNSKWDIAFLAFYDTYINSLSTYSSFMHIRYGRPNKITEYDEYAAGGRLNAGYNINKQHILRAAFSFRQDDHWSYRKDLINQDDIHVRENKISLGLEYEYKPLEKLRFIASGGFDSLLPDSYWSRPNAFAEYMGISSYQVNERDRWLLAAQAGVFYEFVKHHELRLTYARRNQFPTMNDRYSTRLSDSMPNPNLKPEVADHIEFGYKGAFLYKLALDAAVYYSRIDDKMAVIRVPDPFATIHSVDFVTNMDAVSFYGLELSSTLFLSKYLNMGGNLSLCDYSVDDSIASAKTVTYYPKFTLNGYIELLLWEEHISVMSVAEYRSERWIDIYEITSLDSYFLLHLYLAFNITDNFKINMSVSNVLDELYELRQNYPMPGRTYTLGASAKF